MLTKERMKQGNLAALSVALVISALLFLWSQYSKQSEEMLEQQRRETALPDRWFAIRNVAVPDFVQGADPMITYSREIRQPFIGEWIAEIYPATEGARQAACSNSGTSRYDASDSLPDAGVPLSWFMDKDCKLPPGKFVIDTTWIIRPDGYPPKEVRFVSNPFNVLPVGSQLYVTPQQVQILDAPCQKQPCQ